MEFPFFLVLSAVTLQPSYSTYCYTSWANLCWKLQILTSQRGLLQLSSQRAAANANVPSVKGNPDRTYSSLFVVTFRSLI